MRYTVVWFKPIRDRLAEIWLEAPDRASVTAAADLIDRELAQDAMLKGAELRESMRIFHAPPLQVLFVVRDQDRVVEVVRVKRA